MTRARDRLTVVAPGCPIGEALAPATPPIAQRLSLTWGPCFRHRGIGIHVAKTADPARQRFVPCWSVFEAGDWWRSRSQARRAWSTENAAVRAVWADIAKRNQGEAP